MDGVEAEVLTATSLPTEKVWQVGVTVDQRMAPRSAVVVSRWLLRLRRSCGPVLCSLEFWRF